MIECFAGRCACPGDSSFLICPWKCSLRAEICPNIPMKSKLISVTSGLDI